MLTKSNKTASALFLSFATFIISAKMKTGLLEEV